MGAPFATRVPAVAGRPVASLAAIARICACNDARLELDTSHRRRRRFGPPLALGDEAGGSLGSIRVDVLPPFASCSNATSFAGMRAYDIDGDRIETYKDARLAEHGPTGAHIRPATVNRELAALRRMFSLACKTRPGFRHRPHVALLAENNAREGFSEPALFDAIVPELRTRDADVPDVAEFAYGAPSAPRA